ncbi:hypothetical protein [Domibacillus robiginosus]|nr:hypothetical protein [Domibacillus robiginosus]
MKKVDGAKKEKTKHILIETKMYGHSVSRGSLLFYSRQETVLSISFAK